MDEQQSGSLDEALGSTVEVQFRVNVGEEVLRVGLVGDAVELGSWNIEKAIQLRPYDYDDSSSSSLDTASPKTEPTSNNNNNIIWHSPKISLPLIRFPLRLRFIANGHRSSPTTRPLIWDQLSHVIDHIPPDGIIHCSFAPTLDNSDSGWVHSAGQGAFQLRVGQPPGSLQPLITLDSQYKPIQPYRVDVYEASPNDPTVSQGKAFARLSFNDMGIYMGTSSSGGGNGHGTDDDDDDVVNTITKSSSTTTVINSHGEGEAAAIFLLNAQSLEALAFKVDVTSISTGDLLCRCFISAATLSPLEGVIHAVLVTPDLHPAGTFDAGFLVVTAFDHKNNRLCNLQRQRWVPNVPTLDIGHRGSGASKVHGHSVRENTVLSFNKAAVNHSDFIEFDVHVTSDGEVVVHHDFDLSLRIGQQQVLKIGIPCLTLDQLESVDFNNVMVHPREDFIKARVQEERAKRRNGLRRNLSSGEDMLRAALKPPIEQHHALSPERRPSSQASSGVVAGHNAAAMSNAATWFLQDKIASLREAFRSTPAWLGFNIELKYPTTVEVAAMRTHFYSRNHFVDAVLKVVLEEAKSRKVIFSTFDPDCATLLSLKQPRYPVLFLTCGGTKIFDDPRMNSLDAALRFALSSKLQGVVAEATAVLPQLTETVAEFHKQGLFLFTWGDINNDIVQYTAQREAGVDAIIMDDVAKIARATNKQYSLFARKPMRAPSSMQDLNLHEEKMVEVGLERLSSSLNIMALSPIGSPHGGGLLSARGSATQSLLSPTHPLASAALRN